MPREMQGHTPSACRKKAPSTCTGQVTSQERHQHPLMSFCPHMRFLRLLRQRVTKLSSM